MQNFDFARATTVDQAIELLSAHNGSARALSGGTDLLVGLREGRLQADLVVDVKGIPEVNAMEYSAASGLQLGASVACNRMYNDAAVAAAYPGLMDAAHLIGGVQIQGRASMGDNLCNASPAADSIPALIAHSAVAIVAGPNGRREVLVEDFCVAPGRNILEAGEFLVSIKVPAPKAGFGASYLRFIPRNEMDIAVVGVGSSVQLNANRTHIESARISLGAVAPRPLFVKEAGDSLAGKAISDEALEAAAKIAQAAATPISDMRGTAEYRKHIVAVLTRRTLNIAIERAK